MATVAIAAVDGWTDSVPSRRHATFAAFGFNAPKSRAPQAVLIAVPPNVSQRLDNVGLLDVVLETRELAHARAPRQTGRADAGASDVHRVCQRRVAEKLPRRVARMSDPLYLILEPGRTDTDEGMRARVADPVWFITRQWQLGELQGEDASTPVVITAAPQHVPLTYDRARPDLDPTVIPAEALLEAEPGDWWTIGRRVRLGRAAEPLLSAEARVRYRLGTLPAPYDALADGVDGRAVFVCRRARGPRDLGGGALARCRPLVVVVSRLQRIVRSRRHRLLARNHTGGDVDWFTVDGDPKPVPITRPAPPAKSREVIPGRLDYPGAPHPRWWQLENHAVDIGGFAPDRSHFATMLLLDVAIEHADDWFTFPVPPPAAIPTQYRRAACWSRSAGVTVRDSFGEVWNLNDAFRRRRRRLVAVPFRGSVRIRSCWCGRWRSRRIAGPVLDEILIGVDEDANLAWAVELRADGLQVLRDAETAQSDRGNHAHRHARVPVSAINDAAQWMASVSSACASTIRSRPAAWSRR